MNIPPFLKSGSTVAITCPSGYLPLEDTLDAQKTLKGWGFNVIVGKTVGNEFHYFSEDDQLRKSELQSFLDNPEVDAILAGRGGYGLSRIIDGIDFREFNRKPKWIIGFSDITVLHAQVQMLHHTVSIHGPMCRAFINPGNENHPWIDSLKAMLTGDSINYVLEGDEHNIAGEARGELVGGNLAILAHLCGSSSQVITQGKILFIEDIGEYLYSIDRMLYTIKRAGMLDGLAALVCGGFTDLKDTTRPFGATIQEIILDKVKEYDYPICFGFSAGHIDENYPIMLGKAHHISITKDLVQMNPIAFA